MKRNYSKLAKIIFRVLAIECVVLVIVASIYFGMKLKDHDKEKDELANASTEVIEQENHPKIENDSNMSQGTSSETEDLLLNVEREELPQEEIEAHAINEQKAEKRKVVLQKADILALGYDYDQAIEVLRAYEDYTSEKELQDKVAIYEALKMELDPYGAYESADEISHVFFHSLIVDTAKAFDGDHMSNGYNYWMTTVDEFNRMMEQMYEAGYVLISIHDIASEEKQEDGTIKMVEGEILLPKDKKPFVLSQDDVNFYEYMKKDGFARRIVIDDQGYPACEMLVDGQTVVARDFDVVPLLEKFIEDHPDFSYRGARGIIGVTGYEGVLGYRTNETESETYEEDVAQAKEVATRLKELGWEFASHSYGHGHLGQASVSEVKRDSERWDTAIASIIGDTDIYLFPYGEDIQEGIALYDNEKYKILYDLGFRYYCGVYAYPWIQVKNHYVRMTRRNLDGYTMNFYPERLTDLFDVETTMDDARPEFK